MMNKQELNIGKNWIKTNKTFLITHYDMFYGMYDVLKIFVPIYEYKPKESYKKNFNLVEFFEISKKSERKICIQGDSSLNIAYGTYSFYSIEIKDFNGIKDLNFLYNKEKDILIAYKQVNISNYKEYKECKYIEPNEEKAKSDKQKCDKLNPIVDKYEKELNKLIKDIKGNDFIEKTFNFFKEINATDIISDLEKCDSGCDFDHTMMSLSFNCANGHSTFEEERILTAYHNYYYYFGKLVSIQGY